MRKVLKIIGYIIGIVILLLIGVVITLNTQWGQNLVRGKAEAFLNKKLKTEVRIGHFGLGFPKFIVLKDILFKDQAQDTLLAVGELKVDISMMKLISKKVDVQQLVLTGVHAHIYRNQPDTFFNFTYIINAFAGEPKAKDTTKVKDTSASALSINLDRVKLEDIHVRFDDHTGGTLLALNLERLDLRMKELDLEHMLFHIKKLDVAGLQSSFRQDTSYLPPSPKTQKKAKLQLIADNVKLERVNFDYNDDLNKFLFALKLGGLELELKKFELQNNTIDIPRLAINNTAIGLVMGKHSRVPAPIDSIKKIDSTEGWHVNAGKVLLDGVNFKMDNENEKPIAKGIDYAHLDVRNLALTLHDIMYSSDSIRGNVKHLAVSEKSGVEVQELKTVFNYNNQGATLKDLYLKTPHTTLQNHLEVHYPSLSSLKDSLHLMRVNIDIENSVIGLQDVLVFVPDLIKQDLFRKNQNSTLKLEAKVQGMLNSLNIADLYLAGLTGTEVKLNGRLSGLPDAKKLSYNLNIVRLQSTRTDVSMFVPDSALAAIRIPERFGIMGQLSGTIQDYTTDLLIASTDGRAYLKGTLAMSPGKNKERYNMLVKTEQLNLGRILRQDSLMGKVTANITAKGTGFDPKTMAADVDANIYAAELKGYRYHDITLYSKVAAQKGTLDMASADSNLRMQIKAQGDFSGKYAAVKADIKMDSIDFRALKLYSTELRTSGVIHADFPELNPDYPRGQFIWWQPVVTADGKRYYLDSMYVTSRPSADTGQNILIDLDILHARITGKTPLTKIGGVIKEHIDRHYTTPTKDSINKSLAATKTAKPAKGTVAPTELPTGYSLNINADIVDKPMLHSILPGLTSFDSIHVDAAITQRILKLNVAIPSLEYSGTTIDNALVKVSGTDSAFTYSITANEISQSTFGLYFANINGSVDQNIISANVSLSDKAHTERFALAANMSKVGDSQIVSLKPGLKLNYTDWTVAQPNRIVLAGGGFYISNFEISNAGQYIRANNKEPRINSPLNVDIKDFLIANITEAISNSDTILANGVVNGNILLESLSPSPKVIADLNIRNLSYMGDSLGDVAVQVNNNKENELAANVTIKGRGNDIVLSGSYFLKPVNGNDFDMKLDVNALAVRSFETLAMKQIKNSSGFIRGNLKIAGTAKVPAITGQLHTDNLITTVSQLNAPFKMPAEKIDFTKDGISFNDFALYDSAGNKATINGEINTKDLDDINIDLTVKANNWQALNSTEKDNDIFYGDLFLTANMGIKGPVTAPTLDGTLKILKGTNLTVVNPEALPELESTKGIVVFRNMKDTGRKNILAPRKKPVAKRRTQSGSDINVNVTIDKDAAFSLVIDKSSGDFLSVKGEANLNASINSGGTISLAGTYALNSGSYQLNYNFIKRKFTIKDGSSITFAGDPVKGTTLNLTSEYEARIPPYDLVQRQVPDQAQLNYYKQRLPFNVELHMNGPVMTPRITFDVQLPENKVYPLSTEQIELVRSKLSQIRTDTSELNKQVFAVLILNRFVSDDPFSSGASTSAAFTALQSVSTFIGEQLNRAAGRFIKGVDFSVDLATTEDYTTGSMRQRTDLNLAASKRLLDDRLKLTLGNNFELEGPQTSNQQTSYVPSNLAADYLLSADGRYTLRAYRQAYNVGVIQGFVTETGLNFIVSLDYNRFKNAFKKRKPRGIKVAMKNKQNDTTDNK